MSSQSGSQHKEKAVVYIAHVCPAQHKIARALAFSCRSTDLLTIYVCVLCVYILQTYIENVWAGIPLFRCFLHEVSHLT